MSTRTGKLLLAAAVVAAVLLVLFLPKGGQDRLPTPEQGNGAGADAPPGREAAQGDVRVAEAPPAKLAKGEGRIAVTVTHGGVPTAASVEIRLLQEHRESLRPDMEATFREAADPFPAHLKAVTDPGGRSDFAGLPWGLYEVRGALADGRFGTAPAYLFPRNPEAKVTVEVVDDRGTLHGVAVHADGRPFAGRVGVIREKGSFGRPSARTDEAGRFAIPGLTAGPLNLTALVTKDLRVLGPSLTFPVEGEVRFVVDAGLSELLGRVVDAGTGAPVSGARIVGGGSGSGGDRKDGSTIARTRSGPDGSFALAMPQGRVFISVQATGYSEYDERLTEIPALHVVKLKRRAGVSGRVTAHLDGKPVEGATVRWRPGGFSFDETGAATVTDAEGRYAFTGIGAKKIVVSVEGGGWVSRERVESGMRGLESFGEEDPLELRISPGESVTRDLVAVRAGAAEGRVLDAAGAPAKGVRIMIEGSGTDPMARMARMMRHARPGAPEPDAVTDADGRFRVDALVPGMRYTFQAKPPGGAPAKAGPFLAVGGETLTVAIQLHAERRIAVLVVEEGTGRPVAGARVSLEEEGAGMGFESSWQTDERGRVVAGPVPAGPLTLSVHSEEHLRMRKRIRLEPGAKVARVELVPGLSVTGRVSLPDGSAPPKGTMVSALRERASLNADGRTEADGSFRIARLSPGKMQVWCAVLIDGKRYEAIVETEAGWRDLEVVLREKAKREAPKALRVRVLGPDGEPVPRADVGFWHFGKSGEGRTGGRVRDGVASHSYSHKERTGWVEVYAPRDNDEKPLPLGPALVGPLQSLDGGLEIRLPAERTIAGRVEDENGRGIEGVKLMARPLHPELPDYSWAPNPHDTVPTATDGSFRLGRLGDREYRVRAIPPSEYVPPDSVTVRAGATGVVIRVRAGVSPIVTIQGPDGRPLAGAVVSARDPDREFDAMADLDRVRRSRDITDARGIVKLTGLDSRKTYRLDIRPPRTRSDLAPKVVPDWRPAAITIRLDPK